MRMPRPRPSLLALGLALLLLPMLLLNLIARWLERSPDPLGASDAIVVLGGDHPMRVLTAIDLYHDALAPELWITGDVPPPGQEVSSAEASRYVAFKNGVPYEHQQLLASTSTWEDAEQLSHYAAERKVERLIVVTSWYHSRRAMCVLDRHFADQGVLLSYTPSTYVRPSPARWWRRPSGWLAVTRETAAVTYYWLWYRLPPWTC